MIARARSATPTPTTATIRLLPYVPINSSIIEPVPQSFAGQMIAASGFFKKFDAKRRFFCAEYKFLSC
jgi:hypothetical protein